jgi:hypothetical protein
MDLITRPQITPSIRQAAIIGGFGLCPFLALSVLAHSSNAMLAIHARQALLTYGAVIVSFLGGIRFGFVIQTPPTHSLKRLIQSIIPSLTGWAALLLDPFMSSGLLVATLMGMLILDISLTHHQEAPFWYPKLRIPLTLGACLSIASLWF